jgi:hypothetical protein
MIVNNTGRTVRIYAEDRPDGADDIDFGLLHTFDPDPPAVQLTPMPLVTLYEDDIPLELVEFGHAQQLPAPRDGTKRIVPLEVALAQPRRDDLLVTYRPVTTADGTVIGYRELAQPV